MLLLEVDELPSVELLLFPAASGEELFFGSLVFAPVDVSELDELAEPDSLDESEVPDRESVL